jgi:general secretion pathway protein J
VTVIENHSPQATGFTLVELLVALFIFSLIAVAGVTLLRSSADGQIILKDRLASHSAFMRTANLLEADLAQAAPRPVRDQSGNSVAAFSTRLQAGQTGGSALFGFTRNGLSSGLEGVNPAIARVGYSYANGTLARTTWPIADGAAAQPAAILLEGLQSVTMRYRDLRGNWLTTWTSLDPNELPRAVEMTITPAARPPFRLVMLVGSQSRPAETPPEPPTPPSPGAGPT